MCPCPSAQGCLARPSSCPRLSWFLQLGYLRAAASVAARPWAAASPHQRLQVPGQEMLLFWCLILLGGLLPTSQGLVNLGSALGLNPQQPKDGLLGTGLLGSRTAGLLGTGPLGEGGLLGTGLLGKASPSTGESGGASDAGNKPSRSGILGTGLLGGQPGSSGLLGTGIPAGKAVGGGDLSNSLLGNINPLGEKGLLGTGLLGKGDLLSNGSLLGWVSCGVTPRLKALNLENARVSWKILPGGELVLNLYSRLVLRLPGIFQYLSGSSIETNITSHIALTQDSPRDLKLVVKDCNSLMGGFKVNLQKGFLSNVVSGFLNPTLQALVPAVLCPVVNIWVSIINMELQFLNRVISFGLLGKIYSALPRLPLTSEQSVELNLQDSPFPSVFIDWLLRTTGIEAGSVP
ncbi:BPI fold-containing family B member 4-like isoform X2 [Colius striatus]|uniref:BPI fold-containing family B member 4-like isoform X2 n=1 Tax=Colius striatus TaxID=57412 RepID=UPI002B1D2526|nr:BPI fold-containing family B member 4-like isoform X2 [Colius striatus]